MNSFKIKINLVLGALLFFQSIFYSQPCLTTSKNPWQWPSHSNWFLGNNLIGKFSATTLNTSPLQNITSYEGTTGASDDTGKLLFLSNGRMLWDASGNLKYSGLLEGNEGFMSNGSASQGIITVRHPLDTNNYYCFTVDDANQGVSKGLNYFTFDKKGNLKSGPISLGGYRTAEGIAATKHENGVDLWVTVYASGTTNFYTYLITCSGVVNKPVISSVAPNFSGQKERGGLAFSWDSKLFAQVHPDYYPDSDKEVSVYKFNNKTGVIYDPHDISSSSTGDSPYDVLFSPDNSKLYFSTATGTLGYYDITSWNTTTMSASYKAITGVSGGSHSAIEIGGDGNMYMATLSSGLGKLIGNINAGTLVYSNIAGAITNRGLPTMYLPPYEEPEIKKVNPLCVTDPSINLSTTWVCSGLNAEDSVAYPNSYFGQGITNTGTGIFNPAIAGAGTHTIIFQRCSVNDTIFIVVKNCVCPDTTLSSIPPICANGIIDLDNYKITNQGGVWSISKAPIGSSASIIGHTFYANNTTTGYYTVRFTLNNHVVGCPDFAERVILINPLPNVQATAGVILCYGQTSMLNALGANSYAWSNGANGTSISVLPNATTTFTVIGTDINGCSNTASTTVVVPTPIQLSVVKIDPTCNASGMATVTASGGSPGYVYTWSNGQNTSTVTSLSVGSYSVLVTDSKACTSSMQVTLTNPSLPVASFTVAPACFGIPVQFVDQSIAGIGNTITQYFWDFGEPSSGLNNNWNTNTPPAHLYNSLGIYTVQLIIKTNGGCIDTFQKQVEVYPIPKVNFGPPAKGCLPICVNFKDSSTIVKGTIASWTWNFGDASNSNLQNPTHCYTSEGKFDVTLTVESDKGCKNSLTKNDFIEGFKTPKAIFTADPIETELLSPTINFYNQSIGSPTTWSWDFGIPNITSDTSSITNPKWTYSDPGKYNVCLTVNNEIGCSDHVCHLITVKPYWTFYIPNTFTPNGDGINDFFNGTGINITSYQLWIFDRWGDMIYTTDATNNPESSIPWDGRANHGKEIAQQGVYVWKVELKDVFNKDHNYIGIVNLIK